ncbi:AMP-binding protein [Aminicella lysinilytica]|uniref:Long-chain acyl-CoA synthetase n=1 Tax=Aminicella lysinilytica TaxID=433323 RepID=A0A4V6PV01_9FIRM|nr:AMP-binding protein [Aminicella lysinilytica]TDP58422.1 long-chain acyl-CoA synthetase [Aminicella lysinilytica]
MSKSRKILVPQLPKLYDSRLHSDFRELMNYAAFQYMDDKAFIIKKKPKNRHDEPTYINKTFIDFKNDVNSLGTGLLDMGLRDKRIAVIGKNRYEWMLAYFATLCGLGISVPLDKGLPYDEVESSLARSKSDVLVFDKDHLDMVKELEKGGNTGVSLFICMDEIPDYHSVPEIIAKGRRAMKDGSTEYMSLPVNGDEVSIILFTSGTTSISKAVMLSQFNITYNIYAMLQTEDIHHGDVNMAFLPYHHTFGSTGQVLMLATGATTAFCDGLKYVQKNMVEYGVSVFVCVPLLIEAMYKKILAGIKKQGKEATFEKGLKISGFLRRMHIDVRRKLFKDILSELGGGLRFIISGASALDPEVVKGFDAIGIKIVQGYGMTEASPVLSAENAGTQCPGSIGKAMIGVELMIDEPNDEGIGELIARAPNVMHGYYENEEATAETLVDGWLHTGDLASINEDGFIFIRGRSKNVIVLKNGKNIYPEELEILLTNLPYVEENIVYGEPRHKDGDHKDLAICAKIVYNKDYMKDNYGIEDNDAAYDVIKGDIDAINDELPTYKHILRLIVTDEPMDKTTTGKVKRYKK